MTFDAAYESLPATGWLSRAEAELLWRAAQKTSGAILEVGSYFGRSTTLLASLGRPVYAVDPFEGFTADHTAEEIQRALLDNLVSRGLDNVTVFATRIEEWEPRPVGMAYLDGNHTFKGTLAQIAVALACDATVICVHDVNDSGDGREVKAACLDALGPWAERVERLAMWVL